MALLIDADIIAMQSVLACQQEVEFEPDVWQLYCDLKEAHKLFNDAIDKLMSETTQKDYLLCFSDPARAASFRKKLNPTYKANRTARKPVGYAAFEAQAMEYSKKRVRWKPRLEADDVLGILATRDPGKHRIWSIDKDLKQIPGQHLVDEVGEIDIDQEQADMSFYTQVLTGDTVDNYPGCPGIGPVKAIKALSVSDDPWQTILNLYAAAGLTEDDALLQARMAFILRHTHYNVETGKIKLWKP